MKNMTQGNPLKLILMFSMPLMLGNILQEFYTIVDTIIVGQFLGVKALASMGAAGWIQWMLLSVVMGFAQGFSIKVANLYGANNHEGISKTIGNIVIACLVIALLLTISGELIIIPILKLLQTPNDIIQGAIAYLRVMAGGVTITLMYNLLSCVLRAFGNSKTPLLAMVIAASLNVGLDLLFVCVFHLGIAGAAIATILGQMSACFLSIYLFYKHSQHIHVSFKHFKINFQTFKNLYSIAIPSGVMLCMPSLLVSVLNGILASISQSAVAFFGIYFKLQTFIYMPSNGVIQGMRPIISYNYGAKEKKRMDETIKMAGLSISVILLLGTLLFFFFPQTILKMFNANQAMLDIGISGLRILSLAFILSTIGIVMAGVFESLGKGSLSLIISLLRQFIIIIPASLLLIPFLGLNGVWLTFPLSEIIASLVAFILFIKVYKGINPKQD